MHHGLDHLAIVVPNTEEALETWRDKMDFQFLYSEIVNDGVVKLTHLDLGNTQLQLVEPLTADHPLQDWLKKNGPGLHHFCLKVDDVDQGKADYEFAGISGAPSPHQGTKGKRAFFLSAADTQNVQVELTGN
ncbi:VOC family protein [Verrucomicrobia bacterium]|nr:VOC family protein [Verrucomicrobiota bacterium]MDA7916297.1 VOC family protein [Verrucomicrobiota bacterium]